MPLTVVLVRRINNQTYVMRLSMLYLKLSEPERGFHEKTEAPHIMMLIAMLIPCTPYSNR